MPDVALVEFVVDAVGGHGAADEIADAEPGSFQAILFSDYLGGGERAGKSLQLLERQESERETYEGSVTEPLAA